MEDEARVLLNGYFGGGNSGDHAILDAEVQLLESYDAEIFVAATDPEIVEEQYGVTAIPQYQDAPKQWQQAASAVDHVIIGGGGLVTSHNMAGKWSRILLCCDRLNVPIHFVGVGVTPAVSTLHTCIYRWILNRANTIVVRDDRSREYLEEVGVKRPIGVKPDFAFYHAETTLPDGDMPETDTLSVVVRHDQFIDVDRRGLAEAINLVCERTDCKVVLMEFANEESDRMLLEKIATEVECSDVEVDDRSDLRSHERRIARSRYVIGMRLHGVVLAAKHGVPFLSIAYNPKCEYVPEQFGHRSVNWCDDIMPELVAEKVCAEWDDEGLRSELAHKARDQHESVTDILEQIDSQSIPESDALIYALHVGQLVSRAEMKLRNFVGKERRYRVASRHAE